MGVVFGGLDDEQTRMISGDDGILGDPFGGKFVVVGG
jgi:hypothetical protein